MDQIKIGKFIAECRKKNNLTQMQLAEKLNITDRAISKWENGKSMPDSSIMLELCNELKISVNELLSGEMTTRSFSIYQALPHESPLRQRALSLANMGHEVMKDYSNIVSGLAKAIQVTQQESPMLLSQICRILEAGTREMIAPARLHIHLEGDILTEGYYDFFIVLNNLIINAAQAGAHQITAELTAKNRSIVMRVADDAGGIPDDILPHIFQPGFSTKFDEQTGVPSPGLGLCHVRDIVNKWNAQISVESSVPEGTTFRVDIPSL